MSRSLPLLLLVLALSLGACAKHIVHPELDVTILPQPGDIVSKEGDPMSFDQLVEMTQGKQYILIGEGHRNETDHQMQQRLLSALATSDTPPAVGLEMVAVDMQPVLRDFGMGQVELDALPDELEWSERWGYSFDLFRDQFDTIRHHSLPVAGLNVPTRVTRKISREGLEALTDEERAFLPTEIVPPSDEQAPMLEAVFSQHGEQMDDTAEQQERFILVQSIWDTKMAEEAVRLHKEYDWPVLIIAGAGHVEHGWGIARRISMFDPDATILTVMPWRGGEFDADEGDVFFYSPDVYRSRMGATLVATGRGGLLVQAVKRDSRAANAGLRPGDVLIEAAGIPLDHLFSLHIAGKKVHDADEALIFTVVRENETFKADVGKLGQGEAEEFSDGDNGIA